MRIKSKIKVEPKNTEFCNGNIYRPTHTNEPSIYLYACGFLIDIVTGNVLYNVKRMDLKPQDYEDLTYKYALVEAEVGDD